MPYVRVKPDDLAAVTAAVDLLNTARSVDDPDAFDDVAELSARWLEFGWDLQPHERYLYLPDGAETPVGVLDVQLPTRDNRHLVWAEITVHPDHRRRGHGTAMVEETVRRARESGRTTIWLGTAEDDEPARAFLEQRGFHYASHDARRRQRLADVDSAELDRLLQQARLAAADYELERYVPPVPEAILADLVDVTAAINDAPMGELTYEDEVFDLPRLRDIEAARDGRGDRVYRIAARHRATGRLGGHTLMVVNPLRPGRASQGDTAVHRDHRGHRLGLLLKIEMMRWLAEAEPEVEVVETWNNADNSYMINVNESIGYRLSRVFAMYERNLA
ncbi:GNAT family N-acetyltransferase [Microlunatus ginsengisoli]|uniref:GNAT family N-acetyltransferase n=1 Tax=Microlunatus ginsengisoli TaxID=363863 RepID=A0ABP6ZPK9_9ACTN